MRFTKNAETAAEAVIDPRLSLQADLSELTTVVLTEGAETEISVYGSSHDQLQFKLLLML